MNLAFYPCGICTAAKLSCEAAREEFSLKLEKLEAMFSYDIHPK
jgi:hypothetical protein